MFIKITEKLKLDVLDYLSEDILNCVYLYINLLKYGLNNSNIDTWIEIDDEKIKCVVVKYFNGIQIYSKNNDFSVFELNKIINKINPSLISANSKLIDKILENNETLTNQYKRQNGFVAKLNEFELKEYRDIFIHNYAKDKEIYDISNLICSDDRLGSHYKVNELYNQLYQRKNDKFGRNYFIKIDNEIVSHAATYAEIDNIAVIGGVITNDKYRGKGLATKIVSKLSHDLVSECKDVYLFYDDKIAGKIYKKIGFNKSNNWSKLKKK